MTAFGKSPHELAWCLIHPGGMRMVHDCGERLALGGTPSEAAALASLRRGGNIASATVLDMLAEEWGRIQPGEELLVIGMGPGFVMAGAALRCEWGAAGTSGLGEAVIAKPDR